MDLTTKKAFEEYELLKLEEKKIAKRIKELQPLIMPSIPEGKEVQGNLGHFYIQARTTWKFTKNVEDAQARVDELKTEEKAKGIATPEVSQTLYWKQDEKEDDLTD